MFVQSENWTLWVQLKSLFFWFFLCIFNRSLIAFWNVLFAGDLSLFSRKLPGIRSAEPSAHQPHLHRFLSGGFHRGHAAVVQQLRLPGTGASLLAASRGLPGGQGQYHRAHTAAKSLEVSKRRPQTPRSCAWGAEEQSSETCRPLFFYCFPHICCFVSFQTSANLSLQANLLWSSFLHLYCCFSLYLLNSVCLQGLKNVHNFHLHNVAVHICLFAPSLSVERGFLFSYETSRAGTVMPVGGSRYCVVTLVWSLVACLKYLMWHFVI